MISRPLLVLVMLALANRATAEPEPSPSRLRLVVLTSAAIVHYVTDFVIEDYIALERCRWCAPPGFDASVRERVVWDDRRRATLVSDINGYLVTPLVVAGLFAIAARDTRCPWRRLFQDAIPILEAAVYTQLFGQAVKYPVGRQRPGIRFDGTNGNPSSEDNLSFFSGHTSFAFSLAVSSGMVARRRGYKVEPAIWISTLALAATTAYLRLAADKHYLSDILVGAAIGAAGGYLIPHLGTKLGDRAILVPTPNGIAVTGLL